MRAERIVHLGLGAFFRAHQAWYNEHASDAEAWGVVAYTGRSDTLANQLRAQACRYTLITRSEEKDSFETINSIVRAEAGTNLSDLMQTLSNPAVAIVTLTITEAGYQASADSALETSTLGRLALALEARRQSCGLPLAIGSCENMPNNAAVLKSALEQIGAGLGIEFLSYLNSLSFVATSVDRITPASTEADRELVQEMGLDDNVPVVTEPFSDWILEGEFPLGRPAWESAGAIFVSNIEHFENRKLWLLNGAHSLIALYGQLLGYRSVDQAVSDQRVLNAVQDWWQLASSHLPEEELDLENYKLRLLQRFSNPRMSDQLERIAKDSITKLSVRIVPVARQELAAGRTPSAAAFIIASFLGFALGGFEVIDSRKADLDSALAKSQQTKNLVALISPELSEDEEFMSEVTRLAAGLISVNIQN